MFAVILRVGTWGFLLLIAGLTVQDTDVSEICASSMLPMYRLTRTALDGSNASLPAVCTYKLAINKSKMIYTIGPFADISHAKEESSKLTKVLGIDNKISSFVF